MENSIADSTKNVVVEITQVPVVVATAVVEDAKIVGRKVVEGTVAVVHATESAGAKVVAAGHELGQKAEVAVAGPPTPVDPEVRPVVPPVTSPPVGPPAV